jgi:hypothetical protein
LTFEVLLQRFVAQEATVTVEASSEDEAAQLARQRANDELVAWTRVNDEVREQVVPCR